MPSEILDYRQSLNADVSATLDKLRGGDGKIVLNADDLFKLHPRYRDDLSARGILGPQLYPIAREFTDHAFALMLAAPLSDNTTVIFTAGGGASGKSTALRKISGRTKTGNSALAEHRPKYSQENKSQGIRLLFSSSG